MDDTPITSWQKNFFGRQLYYLSPRECQITRKALVDYYQQLLTKIQNREGNEIYSSTEWLELVLAVADQLLWLEDKDSNIRAIERILSAYEQINQTGEVAGEIVRFLREFSHCV